MLAFHFLTGTGKKDLEDFTVEHNQTVLNKCIRTDRDKRH